MSSIGEASMTVELSSELRSAIDNVGTPLKLVDPRSGGVYVLVNEKAYERVQSLLAGELAETYPAQIESAMRAGWGDPVMDEYDDYDRRRAS
jgi:hypothetical protein